MRESLKQILPRLALDSMTPAERDEMLRLSIYVSSCEQEALSLFRPYDRQVEIVRSRAPILLGRGVNRTGKSVITAAMVAAAAMGVRLMDENGVELPPIIDKEPPLLIWVVGKGENHIGQTIHRLLFRPGAFKVIRDHDTGLHRAYRPWDAADHARKNEASPAPPFIPERMLGEHAWAWSRPARRVFSECHLTNGTEIHAYTTLGEVKEGDKPDLIWADEDIADPNYVIELIARMEEDWFRFIWSAFSRRSNTALRTLSSLAKRQREELERGGITAVDVDEFVLDEQSNPHVSQEVKKRKGRIYSEFGDDVYKNRTSGEFPDDNVLMFPEFSIYVHGAPPDNAANDDAVDEILRANVGVPPDDWMCDMIVDPGKVEPGVMFCAIPPPHLKVDCGVIYDEVFLPNSGAEQQMERAAEKIAGRSMYRFLLDRKYGEISSAKDNYRNVDFYNDALVNARLRCAATGTNFALIGGKSRVASYIALSKRMQIMPATNRPWLRVVVAKCPNTIRQIESFKRQVTPEGVVLDEAQRKQSDCFVDTARYWIESRLTWTPTPERREATTMFTTYLERRKERRAKEDKSMHCGPPSAAQGVHV